MLTLNGDPARIEQSILIRDGRIAKMGPSAELEPPRRARLIDGQGRFALPGFTDAHVHIKRSSRDLDRLLPLFLAHGVTTVLNMDGGPAALRLREQVRAGERIGPEIFTTGPIIRGHDKMTAEDGKRIASEHVAAGYDLLKVYNGISEPAYRAIVEHARKAGIQVIGHAVRSVGLDGAIESRQHLAHMEEVVYGFFTWDQRIRSLPDELSNEIVTRLDRLLVESEIPTLAKRIAESGLFVTPNLTAYHHIQHQLVDLDRTLNRPEVAWMPEMMTRSWQRDRNGYMNRSNPDRFKKQVERTFPFLQQLTASFQQANVPLLVGTDVGIPVIVAGSSTLDELEELVSAGLSPRQALIAATQNAARFLGREDAGELEVGYLADLVLLKDNPLVDIGNVRSVETVIARGRVFESKDLLDGVVAGARGDG